MSGPVPDLHMEPEFSNLSHALSEREIAKNHFRAYGQLKHGDPLNDWRCVPGPIGEATRRAAVTRSTVLCRVLVDETDVVLRDEAWSRIDTDRLEARRESIGPDTL